MQQPARLETTNEPQGRRPARHRSVQAARADAVATASAVTAGVRTDAQSSIGAENGGSSSRQPQEHGARRAPPGIRSSARRKGNWACSRRHCQRVAGWADSGGESVATSSRLLCVPRRPASLHRHDDRQPLDEVGVDGGGPSALLVYGQAARRLKTSAPPMRLRRPRHLRSRDPMRESTRERRAIVGCDGDQRQAGCSTAIDSRVALSLRARTGDQQVDDCGVAQRTAVR